ncbi:hypothetical protein PFLmoz3_00381 [Pseudomonas fluorescens]|uniref:Uncharacterized protein n=1 Tax=Pseudomonas fluorescens TaxID=294 RepID=A0A109LLT5_PSEFL|nr:hypothetical protein PFLmoz3_00381 [Pseudomonas fluorescens]
MSSGAVPPELVKRLPSSVNTLELTLTRVNASCIDAISSQCTLHWKPSSNPAWASAQLPVHTAPRRLQYRRAWLRNQAMSAGLIVC